MSAESIALAQSLAAEGDWTAAGEVWLKVARDAEGQDQPTAALAYTEHGRCCLETGRLEQAQASLQIAKTIAPESMLAYRLLGWVAAARGDWRLAAEQWQAVLATQLQAPEEAEALVNLATALVELEDWQGAAAAQDRLAKVSDDPLAVQEQRALLAERQGDLEAAAALWLGMAEARRDHALSWTAHARICLYLGEFGAAKGALERAFALDPGFAPARQVLASIATEQRDWPLAAEQWQAVLDAGPTEAALPEVLYALAGARIEMDDYAAATPLLERLAEVQTDPRNALELNAAMLERQGKWDQAGKLWLDIALLSA